MADVGVLAIGTEACGIGYRTLDVPVQRVAAEQVRPLGDDVPGLVLEQGRACFDGVDGERWAMVPDSVVANESSILWAVSQVLTEDPAQTTAGWQRILVVSWADEDALIPTLRALPKGMLVTVLLGGRHRARDPKVRRNLTLLADLCRRGEVAAILHNPEPDRVLAVALDTALRPTVMDYPRRPAVNVGAAMGFAPARLALEPEVPLFGLVHVPLGEAQQVPGLMADIAARTALDGLLKGPPVDVDGVPVVDLEALRETLPTGDLFDSIRSSIVSALSTVEFVGEEPLTESVARALRPVQATLQGMAQTVAAIENHRILRMRAFGAAGIHFTAHRLRAQLDEVGSDEEPDRIPEVLALLSGDLAPTPNGVHPLAWRQLFAGVPSYVIRRGQPGWQTARELTIDRFSRFKGEFASALARAMEQAVERARDPRARLPSMALRELYHRAERVRDALEAEVATLEGRILAGAEIALRQDGLLRWVHPDPETFRQALHTIVGRHTLSVELERTATLALTRRPLGMVDPTDFEAYLVEVVEEARGLARSASVVPDYETVLVALLRDRDPAELRDHLTDDEGIDPTLFIQRNTSAALLQWFAGTGMRVEVRGGDRCAIYWRSASELSHSAADQERQGTDEHYLADLLVAPPEGDDVRRFEALVRSTALILAGLAVGELSVAHKDGLDLLILRGLPIDGVLAFLPLGGIHALSVHAADRSTLERRVEHRIENLAATLHAGESLQKLVELAELGPSERVAVQVGLDHPTLAALMPAVEGMIQDYARRATAAMIEHNTSEDMRRMSEIPVRHAIRNILQLAPLGA